MTSTADLPYKYVVSDMDGTLLRSDHAISPLTHAVINHLVNKLGVHFIVATGRPHPDVLVTKRKLNLDKCYVITSNGARLHSPSGEMLFERNIDPDVARALACFANDNPDITSSIYQGDRWRMNRHAQDLQEYFVNNREFYHYELFDPLTHESYEDVYKVYFTSEKNNTAALVPLFASIKAKYGDRVHMTYSLPFCVEIMAKGVTKAVGMYHAMQIIEPDQVLSPINPINESFSPTSEDEDKNLDDIPPPNCISFGDGLNDTEMLVMAEKGCMMANAMDSLKAVFFPPPSPQPKIGDMSPVIKHVEVIGTNEDESVAKKLMSIYHIDEADLVIQA